MRLPGQYYDQETGLHYNYHRYYDPRTGRYLTPDPIGLIGGINPFAYSENNPINHTDPLGLQGTAILGGPIPLPIILPDSPIVQKFAKDTQWGLKQVFNPDDYTWPGKGKNGWPWTKENTTETVQCESDNYGVGSGPEPDPGPWGRYKMCLKVGKGIRNFGKHLIWKTICSLGFVADLMGRDMSSPPGSAMGPPSWF